MALLRLRQVFRPDMSSYDPDLVDQVDPSLLRDCKPHHRQAIELALHDLYGKRMEALISLPPSWKEYVCTHVLKDKRDYPLLVTFIQCTAWVLFSSLVQIFLLPQSAWGYLWLLVHIPVTWALLAERFILAMHYSAHRPLFAEKGPYGKLAWVVNNIPQMLLSNFWGMPSGAYYLHHIVMHHNANNCFPYDISSTMPYDRSKFLHWVHYMINFMLHTMLYLPFYAFTKRRFGLAALSIWTTACYLGTYYLLSHHSPIFFNISLGTAFLIGPIALMLGNFSQHIFIDPRDPSSNYGLATNHLCAPFNMVTFNDGYHITHHVNSHCHWSEMPLHFIKNIEQYEKGGAICFRGLNFLDVSTAIFAGKFDYLAKQIVQLRADPLSHEELVAMMRERLKPIRSDGMSHSQQGVFMLNQAMWVVAWLFGFPYAVVPVVGAPIFHVMSAMIMA
ncbi:hypothetical protein AB1Y20_003192 [Prymnesium parvum]|uniref:Fatty acid desaturase domain-containing protein n=1 Tax=Prymnesium parvum TaxID=97485 RepID=A0AB34JDC5_PRYPA